MVSAGRGVWLPEIAVPSRVEAINHQQLDRLEIPNGWYHVINCGRQRKATAECPMLERV
jgi:hypothetical protein